MRRLEDRVWALISTRQFDEARQIIDELRLRGYSAARCAVLSISLHSVETDDYVACLDRIRHIDLRSEAPGTKALAFLERSRYGYFANDVADMRTIRTRVETLWANHGGDAEVRRWRGPTLQNLANHALRNGRPVDALDLFDEAFRLTVTSEDQWCRALSIALSQSRCLCELGRPDEAVDRITEAERLVRDESYLHDTLLAKARVFYTIGQYDTATELLEACYVVAGRMDDYRVVAEAWYLRLLIAVRLNEPDRMDIAEYARTAAVRGGILYLLRMIAMALRSAA